jgi:hypothetical protein
MRLRELFKQTEDRHPNAKPYGPEFKPTMPAGTVRVDVSDVYDWYKLGMHISDLNGLGPHDFGQGPPSTIMAFGSEDEEHKYIKNLKKIGLNTVDIDPLDPNQPEDMPRQATDPRYNVESADLTELFEPDKKWQWEFSGSEEAIATFQVGQVAYLFHAYGADGQWEVEFKRDGKKLDRPQKFGLTGTGNSAEVMGTVVDIMRSFLSKYKDKIEVLIFSAKEDSRQGLYAKMVKRLLPTWTMRQDKEEFVLVAPRHDQVSEEAKAIKTDTLVLKYAFNDHALLMKAFERSTGSPLAFVKFVKEKKELYPENLWVHDDYRNRGIAKTMYDTLKSEGYVINRSHDQTKAGARFWDKHQGEDAYVWEEIYKLSRQKVQGTK